MEGCVRTPIGPWSPNQKSTMKVLSVESAVANGVPDLTKPKQKVTLREKALRCVEFEQLHVLGARSEVR